MNTVLTLKQSLPISLLSAQKLLSDDDVEIKRILIGRLSAAYKLDYTDRESVHFDAARDLFRLAVQEYYTPDEFLQRLDQMLMTCKFYTWTPADFFQHERGSEKLHTYDWVMDEVKKNQKAMAAMEAYRIPGFQKPLWRYADGKKLEEQNPDWKVVVRCGTHFTENLPKAAPAKEEEPIDTALQTANKVIADQNKQLGEAERVAEVYKHKYEETLRKLRRTEAENKIYRGKIAEYLTGDATNEAAVDNVLAAPRYERFQEAA